MKKHERNYTENRKPENTRGGDLPEADCQCCYCRSNKETPPRVAASIDNSLLAIAAATAKRVQTQQKRRGLFCGELK